MPLDKLPDWLPAWWRDRLGGEPAEVLLESHQVSRVLVCGWPAGVTSWSRRAPTTAGAASCVAAQARLAERGFPCARPLTPVVGVGALAVHAEEFRPGGEVLQEDSPDMAVRCAEVFARLMAELAAVNVAPPLPNPPWVRWDHPDPGVWPAIDVLDRRYQGDVWTPGQRRRWGIGVGCHDPVTRHRDTVGEPLGKGGELHSWLSGGGEERAPGQGPRMLTASPRRS